MTEKFEGPYPYPTDEVMAAIEGMFPPRKERPPPRTLYDGLPDGLTDSGMDIGGNPPVELRVPEPLVLVKERLPDELVPAFGKTWRVGLNDLPHLGWVIERMLARCPHLDANAARRILMGYIHDSTAFFQMSERAIAGARYIRDGLQPPLIEVLFILHPDQGPEGGSIKGSQGEKEAIHLVRLMRDWGRLQGAASIVRVTEVSDLPASIVIHDLKAKRRDEVWIEL